MPKPHTGAKSLVDYTIPELDDVADIEVAFSGFADSLPATPIAMKIVTVKADVPLPELNTMYLFDGTGPNTLTLIPGVKDGDKIQIVQMQTGAVTVDPNGIAYQGTTVPPASGTAAQFSALTLVWQHTESRWVALPFSSSGILFPPESGGGDDTIVSGGFRYHIFRNSGSFYSHKDMLVNVLIVGAGGQGAVAGTLAGDGGHAGQRVDLIGEQVEIMQSYPVVIGGSQQPHGGASSFHTKSALGGEAGVVDTDTIDEAPTPLAFPADVLALIGFTEVGGSGPADSGPIAPARYGMGGAGGHLQRAEQARGKTTITVPGSPGSPGTPGYTESYNVAASSSSREERGDHRPVFCPDGWRVSLVDHAFVQCQNIANPSQIAMNGWMGGCPGGWYPCGMNCCTTVTDYSCPGGCTNHQNGNCTCYRDIPGTPGTPGTPDSTQEVWAACPSGYRPKAGDESKCVDERSLFAGEGGDGLVIVWYAV
jgi:hypothetical protein